MSAEGCADAQAAELFLPLLMRCICPNRILRHVGSTPCRLENGRVVPCRLVTEQIAAGPATAGPWFRKDPQAVAWLPTQSGSRPHLTAP